MLQALLADRFQLTIATIHLSLKCMPTTLIQKLIAALTLRLFLYFH